MRVKMNKNLVFKLMTMEAVKVLSLLLRNQKVLQAIGILTESKKEDIAYVILDKYMEKNSLQSTQTGQIKITEYKTEVFLRVFHTELRKLMTKVD